MFKTLITFMFLLILITIPARVEASVCSKRQKLVEHLSNKYKETPTSRGLFSSTGMMEFYVSKRGTWSILMTSTTGISCLIAAGNNFETLRAIVGKPS